MSYLIRSIIDLNKIAQKQTFVFDVEIVASKLHPEYEYNTFKISLPSLSPLSGNAAIPFQS